jgi:hypothetical protein
MKKRVISLTEQDLVGLINTILGDFKPNQQSGSEYFDTDELENNIPFIKTSDDEFYKKVLQCLGAEPTKGNMSFMYAWRQSEGGKATFNPLNTTKNMPGSTIYNNHNVKNYQSMEDGVRATCETLKLGYYSDIVDGLKNDVGLYYLSRMEGLKKWGTGQLLAKVADGYLAGATPKPGPIDTQIA